MIENTFFLKKYECRKQAGINHCTNIWQNMLQTKQERKDKKKDHLRLIKGTRHEKDITILNMSVPNTGVLNFIF